MHPTHGDRAELGKQRDLPECMSPRTRVCRSVGCVICRDRMNWAAQCRSGACWSHGGGGDLRAPLPHPPCALPTGASPPAARLTSCGGRSGCIWWRTRPSSLSSVSPWEEKAEEEQQVSRGPSPSVPVCLCGVRRTAPRHPRTAHTPPSSCTSPARDSKGLWRPGATPPLHTRLVSRDPPGCGHCGAPCGRTCTPRWPTSSPSGGFETKA